MPILCGGGGNNRGGSHGRGNNWGQGRWHEYNRA